MYEKDSILTSKEIRRLENIDSKRLFDEVFAYASETCLVSQDVSYEKKMPTDEARVVAELGIRGLRTALDLMHDPSVHRAEKEMEPDYPLRFPGEFSDSIDLEVMAKIEGLGEGLLNEAYKCLGRDVDEQIARFMNADDKEEQREIVWWLHNRLVKIAKLNNPNHGEAEEDQFYHPIRLSPKVIGVYPDIEIAPSCLGVSIIAASFFHQAGAEVLHAGVMYTRQQEQMLETSRFFGGYGEKVQEMYGLQLPKEVTDSLYEKSYDLITKVFTPEAYHAAVVARLKSGDWMQVDPNFRATGLLFPEDSDRLQEIYDDLVAMKEVAPGLEVAHRSKLGTRAGLCELMLAMGNKNLLPDSAAVSEVLTREDTESIPQEIFDRFMLPYFLAPREVDGLTEVWNEINHVAAIGAEGHETTGAENDFYKMFEKYVLWSRPLLEVLQRCREDQSYLERRIEDICALPLVMLASNALTDVNSGKDHPAHQALEVGLPAFRIGSAVLNDFMNYDNYEKISPDDKISPSFRLSHWSSQVPITATISDAEYSPAQKELLLNNAAHSRTKLPYLRNSGIIGKFLGNNGRR